MSRWRSLSWVGSIVLSMLSFLLGVLSAVSVCTGADTREAPPRVEIEPNQQLQLAIQRVLDPRSAQEHQENLEQLQKLGGRHCEILVPQLLYYSMHGRDREGRHDVREAMALPAIARLLDIDNWEIAAALIPYLETGEPKLRQAVEGVLASLDFSLLELTVQTKTHRREELPPGLVRYMYLANAGRSMLAIAHAFSRPDQREDTRRLLWAEHVISDTLWKHEHGFLSKGKVEPEAMTELEKLSKDEAWWVRLYAAHIVNKAPGFRQPDIVARLKKDTHPLVREAMGDTQPQPGPPRSQPKQ